MRVPNPDIDDVEPVEFVAAEFGIPNNEKLTFRPVRGDSWSYRLGRPHAVRSCRLPSLANSDAPHLSHLR